MRRLRSLRSFAASLPLCLAAALDPTLLRGEDAATPAVRVHPLSAAPSATVAPLTARPAAASGDLAGRLRAALAAARAPGEPVPHPASAAAAEVEPLTPRIGRDVTVVPRPGVGTPAQIRGERLQVRAENAAPDGDFDLATARTFLHANRRLLGLRDPDRELAPSARFTDELGLKHLKFEQRLRGLSVWPAELVVHLDQRGDVYLVDGAFIPTPRLLLTEPIVRPEDAAVRARERVAASSRLSAPELLVYAGGSRGPRLAWRIEVTGPPEDSVTLFIDAINRAVLGSISRVMTENVAGAGVDLFGRTVPLNVWHEGSGFLLIDTSKAMFRAGCNTVDLKQNCGAIYIGDAGHTPPSSSPDASQADVRLVSSSSATSWTPADAVSAASNFSRVFDYYLQRHGRNSIDGAGGNILAITRLGQNYPNAFWTDAIGGMFFGDADRYAGSLDVVGHEMTHGVTSRTAGLIYQDQSGALNEAISDIFGEMVEYFANGSNDWLHDTALRFQARNLANPSAIEIIAGSGRFYPSKMSQYIDRSDSFLDNFVNQDNGGVHLNSGIINHAYYLLAQGESGAIGQLDAERIFYRALTLHLTKNSQFLDARLACIQSADEIFGAGSNQAQRVAQAFDAVEVLPSTPAPPPPTTPPGTAADSVFFLAHNGTSLVPSRRETALGDPSEGVYLFTTPAAAERPAVSGDGTLAFFVTDDNDACFVATDGSRSPACLDLPGSVASVAMSRDASVYAFVLLDSGERTNDITVIDLGVNPPRTQTYDLLAPTADGGSVTSVLFADTMDFTRNQRYLLYDALNVLRLEDGTTVGLWSISAIDFATSQTYVLAPPAVGFDIGNPAVAHTSDNFITFDAQNQTSGFADIYAASLSTGVFSKVIRDVQNWPTTPAYTGNDRAIVYAFPDGRTPTGHSLAIEQLAADHLTAVGNPSGFLSDGTYAVIYRRGASTAPGTNCHADAQTLCLSSNRFQVTATFTTPQGQKSSAQAKPLTADTGYFTFFDPSNVEVVVKVLNACSFSPNIWVFAGGLTNVATIITVTDTATGVIRTYSNPQDRKFRPIQDTEAFSTCFAGSITGGAASATSVAAAWREVEALAGDAAAPPAAAGAGFGAGGVAPHAAAAAKAAEAPDACVPDNQYLCLSGGRFRVSATFRTRQGDSGNARAVKLTGDTGYFWFFNQTNVEVVVKVLNACGPFDRFWVFAAGLTDVEVTLTVFDSQAGITNTYHNNLGVPFDAVQDTGAFATCP